MSFVKNLNDDYASGTTSAVKNTTDNSGSYNFGLPDYTGGSQTDNSNSFSPQSDNSNPTSPPGTKKTGITPKYLPGTIIPPSNNIITVTESPLQIFYNNNKTLIFASAGIIVVGFFLLKKKGKK